MEKILIVPAVLMVASMIMALTYFLKLRKEVSGANWLVHFLGHDLFSGKYLSKKGLYYRKRYWQSFLMSFVFSVIMISAAFCINEEFRAELLGLLSGQA